MRDQYKYKLVNCLYLPVRDVWWGVAVVSDLNDAQVRGRSYNRWFWCWWGQSNKTITVKKHPYNIYVMQKLVKQKTASNYDQVTVDQLNASWPSFFEQLECRMVFEALKDD